MNNANNCDTSQSVKHEQLHTGYFEPNQHDSHSAGNLFCERMLANIIGFAFVIFYLKCYVIVSIIII